MVARDQFVGKWQVPTSNYAMSLRSFDDVCGEVISIGERPVLSIHNAAASMRMAIAEAVTNMMSVPIQRQPRRQICTNASKSTVTDPILMLITNRQWCTSNAGTDPTHTMWSGAPRTARDGGEACLEALPASGVPAMTIQWLPTP